MYNRMNEMFLVCKYKILLYISKICQQVNIKDHKKIFFIIIYFYIHNTLYSCYYIMLCYIYL